MAGSPQSRGLRYVAAPVGLALLLAVFLGTDIGTTLRKSVESRLGQSTRCSLKPSAVHSLDNQALSVNRTAFGPEIHSLLQALSVNGQTNLAPAVPSCRPQGSLDDCCNCTYQDVDEVNERVVYPTLKQLVATPFFRYFKVNLWCDCPLWPDDSMCAMRACSVCECDADELPQTWLTAEAQASCKAGDTAQHGLTDHSATQLSNEFQEERGRGGCDTALCAAEADGVVDREMEPKVLAKLQHLKGWRGLNNPWMAEGEEDEEFLYINLLANPERYTGYKGEHAHRIWSAIYNQSCFTELEDCHETRVFYRLISGMHASISAHIAANYLLDEDEGVWGPSLDQFKMRLGTPATRQRIKNLYFAYLFVLRAVNKAGVLLNQFEYDTGMSEEDVRTKQLIKELLSSVELPSACFMPFEPGRLWQGEAGGQLLHTMQKAFRNITRIMDCVGCEKCKLWGKLQTLGIATALKILFSTPDCAVVPYGTSPAVLNPLGTSPTPSSPHQLFTTLTLERNEVIALVNLLERFSASLHYYAQMSEMLSLSEPSAVPVLGGTDTIR